MAIFSEIWPYVAVSGASGGVACYLVAFHKGYYKNNKLKIKFSTEVLGGSITATGVSSLLIHIDEKAIIIGLCFFIGTAWAAIIQTVRKRVTAIVLAAIGNFNTDVGQQNVD